ncbi:hypothetical protein [Shimia sp.]|uniref:hypothetical protein n=1 Tax=Shimia sp. TaxID=1954381 RepID=UPI00329A1047
MSDKKPKLSDIFYVQSTIFIPVWRRVVVVAACALWAIIEFVNGNTEWAIGFCAVTAFCAHQFFIAFDPVDKED